VAGCDLFTIIPGRAIARTRISATTSSFGLVAQVAIADRKAHPGMTGREIHGNY